MLKNQIKIMGTGKYLPERVVLSSELDKRLNKKSGWVENKSGVYKRHFASAKETSSFMAAQAAERALLQANIKSGDLDCIVSACGVGEQAIPSTASLIQRQLGLERSGIAAFDVNSTCLSFLSALDVLSYMLNAGRYERALIVSSDIPSVGLDWSDMESCTIFGDGAAAVVISSEDVKENAMSILASRIETYSEGSAYCQVRGAGTKIHPLHFKGDFAQYMLFEMDGKAVYKLIASLMSGFIKRLLDGVGLSLQDIDLVVPHQASLLAMHHLWKKLGIPKERTVDIFSTHGNQVAASIPTALHEAYEMGRIKRGDKVLLLGTSAGISLGGMVLECK